MAVDHNINVAFPNDKIIKIDIINQNHLDVSFGYNESIKISFPDNNNHNDILFNEDTHTRTSLDDFPFELRIGIGAMRVLSTFKVGIYYD
jgi:hypothetical protein